MKTHPSQPGDANARSDPDDFGTLRRTDDGWTLVFERHLDPPPEQVWTMLTDPEAIARWYVRTELDPREGGRIVEHHDHVGLSMEGEVTRYQPPRTFAHVLWMDQGQRTVAGSVRWTLYPVATGTRLVLESTVPDAAATAGPLAGWHICLDILTAVLAGADPAAHAPPGGTFLDGHFEPSHPGRGRWRDLPRLEAIYADRIGRAEHPVSEGSGAAPREP